MDKLACLTTYLIFLLTPLMFFKGWLFPFISSRLPLFYIFSALAFFFIAAHLISRAEDRPTKKQLLPMLPLSLLVASLGVSAWLSPFRGLALWSTLDRGDGWFFLLHLFLLIFTVYILVIKDSASTYKRNILLATLSAAGIVAASVWLGNEGLNAGGRILSLAQGGGLLDNSSLAATYLLFNVFFGLVVIFSRDLFSQRVRRFALVVVVLTVASPIFISFDFTSPLALLGSGRGAAVGIILGLAVALAFRLSYAPKKLFKFIGLAIIVASLVGYAFFFISIQQAGSPLQTIFKEQAGANRLIFWDIAGKAVKERPVFGWGLENFRVPFHRHFDPALLRTAETAEPWTDRAHNIFYDLAVAGGFVGLLLFLIVIASLVGGIYIAGQKKLLSPWSAALLLGGVYVYLFQGLFVFDSIFSYLMLGFLYAFSFGLIQSSNEPIHLPKRANDAPRPFKIVAGGVLLLGLFASVFFIVIPLGRTASSYGQVVATPLLDRTALWSRIRDDKTLMKADVDLARLVLYAETEYGKKRSEIFGPGNEQIREGLAEDFKIIASIMDQSARLQREGSNGAVMYMTLNVAARTYNSSLLLSGQKDEKLLERAEHYARESIKESPSNPQGYWILAQALVLQNKIPDADEMLEKAISIDPLNEQSRRLKLQLEQAKK